MPALAKKITASLAARRLRRAEEVQALYEDRRRHNHRMTQIRYPRFA